MTGESSAGSGTSLAAFVVSPTGDGPTVCLSVSVCEAQLPMCESAVLGVCAVTVGLAAGERRVGCQLICNACSAV